MPYRNTITNEYFLERPHRVRLEDGFTRTEEEVTDELLAETGWVWEELPPEPEPPIIENTSTTIVG
jgi:hypothetical protein